MYIIEIINGSLTTEIHGLKTKLKSGKITKGINTIDSFTFSLLPDNPGFGLINEFTTLVTAYNTNKERYDFVGRVLYAETTMDESGKITKTVTCENIFGYLCDSVQTYVDTQNWTVEGLLQHLIDCHNSQVEAHKQFKIGNITKKETNDNIYIGIQRDNTWEAINTKLIDQIGGEIQGRVEDDGIYIDYLERIGETKTTEIALSVNMKSITREQNPTSYVTRLIPLGCKLTDENGEETEQRLDITSANNGLNYIDDTEAIKLYGIHVGIVEWDNVTDSGILLTKGEAWIKENNKVLVRYSVTALDLSLLGLVLDDFDVGNWHPLKNSLIGIDDIARVIKKTIDVCDEIKSSIEIGDSFKSISDIQRDIAAQLKAAEENVSNLQKDSKNVANQLSQINKVIAESKAFVGVSNTVVYYYLSTSNTELVGGSWSEAAPEWKDGCYYWQKTITTYTDNSTTESNPVCISGETGTDGTGIESIVEQYYQSASATDLTGGSWSTNPPEWVDGKYVWTRSVVTYTDGTVVTTSPVCVTGAKGSTGNQGIGIASVDVWYYLSTSSTALSGGVWSTTAPEWVDGKYMWSKTVTTYSDKTSTETKPACITGAKGNTGAAGVGVDSIQTQFYLSNSKTTQSGGSWVATMPKWSKGYYLWTRSVITYSDGSVEYTEPICDTAWELVNEVEETFTTKIEQLTNSIKLEVSGSLGSNASIILSAGANKYTGELSLEQVRQAFADDPTAISISAGTITFNSNTLIINSSYFTLDASGYVTATGGTIGGWTLKNYKLYAGDGKNIKTVCVQAPTSSNLYVFAAGGTSHDSYADCPFRVTKAGKLYASDAVITGSVVSIDSPYKTEIDFGSLRLYWNDDLCGTINTKYWSNASAAGISLRIEEGGKYIMFSHPTEESATGWEIDYYLNYGWSTNYDEKHIFQTSARFLDKVYFSGLGAYFRGLYLYNNNYIKSVTNEGTVGEEMLGFDGTYVSVGSRGCATLLLGTTVYLKNTSTTVTSDRNAKNSIEALPDAYETFFDNLEPVRFKFNEGTSGRYHVGFIAQDVEAALTKSGLSSMDFAGYVDINFSGELGLSYDEFIAVLHNKIKRLEQRIAVLEQ